MSVSEGRTKSGSGQRKKVELGTHLAITQTKKQTFVEVDVGTQVLVLFELVDEVLEFTPKKENNGVSHKNKGRALEKHSLCLDNIPLPLITKGLGALLEALELPWPHLVLLPLLRV